MTIIVNSSAKVDVYYMILEQVNKNVRNNSILIRFFSEMFLFDKMISFVNIKQINQVIN